MKRWLLPVALTVAGLGLWWLAGRPSVRPLPEDVSVTLRGHFEAAITAKQQLTPLYLGVDEQFYVCLQAPATRDTSQWEAHLSLGEGEADEAPFRPPEIRMEATLCFRAPAMPRTPAPSRVQICGQLLDTYDRTFFQLPCQSVQLSDRGVAYWKLNERIYGLAAAPLDESLEAWLKQIEALTGQAEEQGFPFLAQHGRLIAANRLRAQGEDWALKRVDKLLKPCPKWIEDEAALELRGETLFEQAELDFQRDLLQSAWNNLNKADQVYLQVAHPFRLPVLMRQAEILAQMGSADQAAARLKGGLDQCERSSANCDPRITSYAENMLAWLSLLDPDSDPLALSRAGDLMEEALTNQQHIQAQETWADPLEPANILINLAYQRLQAGLNPTDPLQKALLILAEQPSGMSQLDQLRDWARLIEALFSLSSGNGADALLLCQSMTGRTALPLLASWAFSCSGRAQVQLGKLSEARESFRQAILIHGNSGLGEMGRGLPLGPGQRADDYYRLARVLVDLGDRVGAWQKLAELDLLAESERQRVRCREQAIDAEVLFEWRRNDQRRRRLLNQLIALEAPASGLRRAQLRPVRQALMQELQDVSHRWPGCSRGQAPALGPSADFRALGLEDEILLLHHRQDGEVVLDHRTPILRRQGRRWIQQLAQRQQQGVISKAEWRQLLKPLAEALLPRRKEDLGQVTLFSLHGWLQDVPLSALPLGGESEDDWLSDWTIVALRPAGLSRGEFPSRSSTLVLSPLFVVDPQGDLQGGRQLLAHYERLFPQARILSGDQANRASLRAWLPSASFLHVDAHGLYDPAFAELSRLQLADGPLTLLELSELPAPAQFVNLSGCHTGRWPVTADSGRYGMAGVLARGGASWVIASRSDLNDQLARDFNRSFYRSIADGSTVPQAFQSALREVRSQHSPSAWSSLMLIRGAGK